MKPTVLLLAMFLTACSSQQLLPMTAPEDGSLIRCSKAEAQAAGSVISIGGRVDSCQCVHAGKPIQARMTVKLPGCEWEIEGGQ